MKILFILYKELDDFKLQIAKIPKLVIDLENTDNLNTLKLNANSWKSAFDMLVKFRLKYQKISESEFEIIKEKIKIR